MRENCTSGSTRGSDGKGVALQQPPVTLYSTERLSFCFYSRQSGPFGLRRCAPLWTSRVTPKPSIPAIPRNATAPRTQKSSGLFRSFCVRLFTVCV